MKIFRLVLCLLVVGFGMGCKIKTDTPIYNNQTVLYLATGYRVLEFKLVDGTRCVSVTSGGLTCDWK